MKGIVASTAGLAILLEEGIGDTIRVSLTPAPGGEREEEVRVAQQVLQSMGLRSFLPQVSACPGCGRTTSTFFQEMAERIQGHLRDRMPEWQARYPGVESMTVAVMGCVVNGPGESKHADIGISLPGTFEEPVRTGVHRRPARSDAPRRRLVDEFIDIARGATSSAADGARAWRRFAVGRRAKSPRPGDRRPRRHASRDLVWRARAVRARVRDVYSAEQKRPPRTWVTPTYFFRRNGTTRWNSERRTNDMSRDFVGALLQLNAEKQVSREQLIRTVEEAIAAAYRRVANEEDIHVQIDAESGHIRVYRARYRHERARSRRTSS